MDVKKIREFLKLTQQGLALLLGVHVRTVAGWEAGTSRPRGLSLRRLKEIMQEYKIPEKDLA